VVLGTLTMTLAGGFDARPTPWPPGPCRATGGTDRAVSWDAVLTMTTMTQVTFAKAHEHIADTTEALRDLEACLYASEHWRFARPRGPRHPRQRQHPQDTAPGSGVGAETTSGASPIGSKVEHVIEVWPRTAWKGRVASQ
jgi:hypothetical protein